MSDDARTKVRAFIEPRLAGRTLKDSDDIFAMGYVNSLFAMQLVRYVQSEFDLELGNDDMDFDNFRTVNGIMRLVESKAQAASGAS